MLKKLTFALRHPRRLARKYYRLLRSQRVRGHCLFCGREATFFRGGASLRETFHCLGCGSNLRQRHLAAVLAELHGAGRSFSSFEALVPHLEPRRVYLCQSFGPLHRALSRLEGYVCSEFFPDRRPGEPRRGVRAEDLQALTFADCTFDLVITQDVFEHVREPWKAFGEIHRVLRPGGRHVFSIPFAAGRKTVKRVEVVDGRDVFHHPAVYHDDDVRDGLVYTDFGGDLLERLAAVDLPTEVHWLDDGTLPPDASCILVSTRTC